MRYLFQRQVPHRDIKSHNTAIRPRKIQERTYHPSLHLLPITKVLTKFSPKCISPPSSSPPCPLLCRHPCSQTTIQYTTDLISNSSVAADLHDMLYCFSRIQPFANDNSCGRKRDMSANTLHHLEARDYADVRYTPLEIVFHGGC